MKITVHESKNEAGGIPDRMVGRPDRATNNRYISQVKEFISDIGPAEFIEPITNDWNQYDQRREWNTRIIFNGHPDVMFAIHYIPELGKFGAVRYTKDASGKWDRDLRDRKSYSGLSYPQYTAEFIKDNLK